MFFDFNRAFLKRIIKGDANKFRYLLLFLFVFTISHFTYSQNNIEFLNDAVTILEKQPAQEKIYLHLDKPNYGFGDTIWYKAYTVIGQKHQLSALSGVLYVELINTKDSLITRQTLSLVSGISWSDIPLPHTLKPGTYRIRAHTRWMQNMGPDYFYDQKIQIGGSEPSTVKPDPTAHPDIQFFPEGGELVNGVRSRIAIKAVGPNGLGENIKGTIADNNGNIVAEFTTQHLGMGAFALTPETGKSYSAKINLPGETTYTIDLPKAKETGYTLALNNTDKDSIYIKIATNEQTLNADKDKTFYIIAQSSGKVYYTTQGKLEDMAYMARVEKSRFPEGIVQFTLFSQNGEPLAERIAFVDNIKSELNLDINTSAPIYTTRDKVKLSLTAKGDSSKAVSGSFSVSVINESKVLPDENDESTIENNLLLTSELKGYIEQPNYYFNHINDKTRADLDNLMLTQGYRKYDWKQILNSTPPNIVYQPEHTQELSGILTTPGGKPVPNGKVTLAATKQNIFRDTTADANGKFTFTNLAFTDTTTLVIKARKQNNGSNVIIKALLPDYPKITPLIDKTSILSIDTINSKRQYINYQKEQNDDFLMNGKTLNTVNIKGIKRPKQPELIHSSNLNGPDHANQVVMYDQLGTCANLTDCLVGHVFGVTFSGGKAHSIRGRAPNMTIIIDGVILDSKTASLDDINPDNVYSIEVLRSGAYLAIYGSNAPGGALVITMKRGGEGTAYFTQAAPNGIITYLFPGFYKAKAFYMPKYEPKGNAQIRDTRTTIYWNPNILTDKDGKAKMEYFNNDTKGTYRVVVEGIDDNGNLGRAVYRYEVK